MAEVAYPLESLVVKSVGGKLKGVDVEKRIVPGYIHVPELDRDKEFLPTDAFMQDLDIYKSNPVLLLHHHHKSLPVGKALKIQKDDQGLYAEYYIAPTPLGDEVLTLCSEGILRGFSGGFMPIDFKLNPPDYELPLHVRGKGCKKLYKRVELVEVSLLAIPSNRNALVIQAEKGNKTAELIMKSFDLEDSEDISLVLNEWLESVDEKFWDESEHPRASDGKFTEAGGGAWEGVKSNLPKRTAAKIDIAEGVLEQLQTMRQDQVEMKRDLKKVKDKTGWKAWAKKWAIRAGALVGAYAFFKSKKGKQLSAKAASHIMQWLGNKLKETAATAMSKGVDADYDEVKTITDMLDHVRRAMAKAKKFGAENTEEHGRLKRQYDDVVKHLKALVDGQKAKGLDDLLIAYQDQEFVTKSLGNMLELHRHGILGGLIQSVQSKDYGLTAALKSFDDEQGRYSDGKYRHKAQKPKSLPIKELTDSTNPKDVLDSKGLNDVVTKETAESFARNVREGDHPRDASGRFTDTGRPPPPPKPKVGRGGKRPGAGRLPKYAHQAVPKITQRIKEQNPDWDDEQIKYELLRQAEERGKPDWEEFVNRPEEYTERLRRQQEEIVRSRYNRTMSQGQEFSGIDSPSQTSQVRDAVRTSEREFQREVKRQKEVKKAWEVFKDKNAAEMERNHAKLVLAIGAIAGFAGVVGPLLLHKPYVKGIKFREFVGRDFWESAEGYLKHRTQWAVGGKITEPSKRFYIDVAGEGIRGLPTEATDILTAPNPTWFRLRKIVSAKQAELRKGTLATYDPVYISENDLRGSMGKLRKMIGRYLGGEGYALTTGEKFTGKFGPREFHIFDSFAKGKYKPRIGDYDGERGIRFIYEVGNKAKYDNLALYNIRRMYLKDPQNPSKLLQTDEELAKLGLRLNPGVGTRSEIEQAIKSGRLGDIERGEIVKYIEDGGLERFKNYWKSMLKKYKLSEDDLRPRYIGRIRNDDELKAWDRATGGGKEDRDWLNILFGTAFPLISKKALAQLTVRGGLAGTTAYAFLKEFEGGSLALDEARRASKRDELERQRAVSKLEQPETSEKERKREHARRIQELKNEQRRLENEAKRIDKEREQATTDEEIAKANAAKEQIDKTREQLERSLSEKGFDSNIVMKAANEERSPILDLEGLTTHVADEITTMMSDISDAYSRVIENGMPGHEQYEELADILTLIYMAMKAQAKIYDEGQNA